MGGRWDQLVSRSAGRRRGPRWLIAAVLVAGACTPSGTPPTTPAPPTSSNADVATAGAGPPVTTVPEPDTWVPPEHPVGVDDGHFVDRRSGEPFVVRGVNYLTRVRVGEGYQDRTLSPAVFDRDVVSADFARLAERGWNTVRIFLDTCNRGPGCIGDPGGRGLDGGYLDVIVEVMELARSHGLFLILTSNDVPDGGGYAALIGRDDAGLFPGYRNSLFMTRAGEEAAVTYWDDLLGGLVDRNAPFDAVLGWSILNEQWMFGDRYPLAEGSGVVTTKTGTYDTADPDQKRAMVADGVRSYVAAVAAVIRDHDPDGLVTMGFFAPSFPNPTTIGGDRYVDTASLVRDSALDFFDFHAYPGEDIPLELMAENFGLPADRPVIMGEVGAFVDRFPDIGRAGPAVQRWIAESCELGWEGWLYWEMSPPDPSVGDATWALTADGGFLLDSLAPLHQPDACVPTLVDPNLAFGGTATASRSLEDQAPALAVDGDPATAWVSGSDAPQWIEIDLGAVVQIGGFALRVDQFPAGRTVHTIAVDGVEVAVLDGDTEGGEVLHVGLGEPIEGRVVRVTTSVSPSWVAWSEIEVLAPG